MSRIQSLLYLLLCFSVPFVSKAQKIEISLPEESNKEYVFILSKGTRQDTIQQGNLSFAGTVTVQIPEKDKNYVGMGSLQIAGRPSLNLIVNNENFTVKQDIDGKYKFTGSRENDYLYFIMQDRITPAQDTTLYAYHFVGLIRYMQQLNAAVQGFSLKEKTAVRSYAQNQLDMEQLYTSSIWYNVIDGLLRLNPDQTVLGEDMVHILKRIKSPEVFEHLVNNLITITEQYGWDDAFDIIVPYVEQSGRIKYPKERLFMAFALAKVRKGMPAPAIEGLKPSLSDSKAKKTLLVFYEPDCDNCRKQLRELIKIYPQLNQSGVRIVSISADNEKESFEKDKKNLPWPDSDKLCDLQGFSGKNFLNYGIMATPTFFLVDEKGQILKRYALVADIDFSMGNEK